MELSSKNNGFGNKDNIPKFTLIIYTEVQSFILNPRTIILR